MPKTKYYITTPIYYVNDVPHIGHAYTTIAADVIARHHRLKGEDVFFLTGTDEHGQKVESAAKAKNTAPKEYVDKVCVAFKDAWKTLNISHDYFIRTTDAKHKKVVAEIIKKCYAAGDIYKGDYEGQYCMPCESYWTQLQLVNNNCPTCGRATALVKEEAYFFKLSKYQKQLLEFYEKNSEFLAPTHRAPEIISRVKEELKDLSITRTSFHWGIPFPLDKKHVTYVWFDALTNYISAINYPKKKFQKYWPADVHVIGKEINWFHTVIWPAMLFSAGIMPPKKVYAHGWLTVNGEKMSKSKGNVISPQHLAEKYGVDVARYFLLSEIPFGQDGDFNESALIARANAELADALGNLLQRTLVLLEKNCEGKIPKPSKFNSEDESLIKSTDILSQVDEHMNNFEFHRATKTIWTFINECNKYVTQQAPWKIEDKKRLNTVLYCLIESLRIISIFVYPFMPATAEKITEQIGQKIGNYKKVKFCKTTKGTIKRGDILFKKLELPKKDPFSTIDLRVAKIIDVKNHPNADKLYVLTIDLGAEQRTLVAGIKPYVKPEELANRLIVVVANLKPHDFRGVVSQGMLLAAEKEGKVVPIAPKGKPGEQVTAQGITPSPAQQITIEEFGKIVLTTKNKEVVYGDKKLVTSSGTVTADVGDGARIK